MCKMKKYISVSGPFVIVILKVGCVVVDTVGFFTKREVYITICYGVTILSLFMCYMIL